MEVKYVPAKRNLSITEEDIKEVKCWKQHYGFRQIGETPEKVRVISGLDVYKMTSSVGLDLELVLTQLQQENCVVDWIGYVKSATIEHWLIQSIITKIKFPITEAYGRPFWEQCELRIKKWAIDNL